MANPNATPFMGETEDDDSSESPRSYSTSGNFLMNAAARAEQQAAEQQRREEQQREIFKALGLKSAEDDEGDDPFGLKKEKISAEKEEDSAKAEAAAEEPEQPAPVSLESQQLESEAAQAVDAEQPAEEAIENKVGPDGELRIEHDPEPQPEPVEVPEYEMASEEAEQPLIETDSEVPASEEAAVVPPEDVEAVPPAETIPASAVEASAEEPAIAVELPPEDVEPEGVSPADAIQAASMSEEVPDPPVETAETAPAPDLQPEEPESPPRDTPPPPPEEPPVSHEGGDRLPPLPSDSDREELPPATPESTEVQQRHETVVERHSGGVGAALMAFFAANWLGRRRFRKNKAEIKKLDNELQEARERSEAERRYVRASERRAGFQNQEQQAKIARLERAQAAERAGDITMAGIAAENETEAKAGPVPLSEVLAATGFARSGEARSEKTAESGQSHEVPVQAEQSPAERHDDYLYQTKQEELLKNREQQQEEMFEAAQDDGMGRESSREIVLERQKETKNDPAPATVPSGYHSMGSNGAQTSSSASSESGLTEGRNVRQDAAEDDMHKVSLPESAPEDLYRKSLMSGAAVGAAVVILGAVVYFLMF